MYTLKGSLVIVTVHQLNHVYLQKGFLKRLFEGALH